VAREQNELLSLRLHSVGSSDFVIQIVLLHVAALFCPVLVVFTDGLRADPTTRGRFTNHVGDLMYDVSTLDAK
jgi:hypothetical protein